MNSTTTQDSPYTKIIMQLGFAFDHFNKIFAEGKLKRPIITAATRGRKNALGWFRPEGWSNGDKEHMHEINISAEKLGRSWDDLCETLLHEMAHLWNQQHNIQDCNAVQYHNRKFKTAAEMFGLVVTKMKNKGFAITELGPKAKEAIKSLGIKQEDVPQIRRRERRGPGAPNSFVLCTHDDKSRFVSMAAEAGMSQVQFIAALLDQWEAHTTLGVRLGRGAVADK